MTRQKTISFDINFSGPIRSDSILNVFSEDESEGDVVSIRRGLFKTVY